MSYYYEGHFKGETALKIETVMRQTMSSQISFNAMQEKLRAQGLGYNRQKMQGDYRRFQAIDRSHTPEARQRAELWYEKVYEPLRQTFRGSSKQTAEFLRMIEKGTAETIEQAEKIGEYAELYEQHF